MRIGEHPVREHVRLLAPALVLVAGVWLLRLIIGAAGTPISLTKIVSVTVATTMSVLLTVILIHARRFGGYTNVVVASLLINLWSQLLIILSIVFSIVTRIENVYTAPEFSLPGTYENQWAHIHGHLTFGVGVGSLVGAAEGCLLLWLLRRLLPPEKLNPGSTT